MTPGAHAELFLPRLRHRGRHPSNSRVTADSPLVGMSVGDAEAPCIGAPLLLALRTGEESRRRRRPTPASGGQRARYDGPARAGRGFRADQFLRLSARLRTFADPVQPQPAGISEAVSHRHRASSARRRQLRLRKQDGISLLAINRDKQVLRDDVRNIPIRAGDMLVLHSIWTDLAQARNRISWWSPTTRRTSSARTSSRSRWRSSPARCCWPEHAHPDADRADDRGRGDAGGRRADVDGPTPRSAGRPCS